MVGGGRECQAAARAEAGLACMISRPRVIANIIISFNFIPRAEAGEGRLADIYVFEIKKLKTVFLHTVSLSYHEPTNSKLLSSVLKRKRDSGELFFVTVQQERQSKDGCSRYGRTLKPSATNSNDSESD